MPVKSQLSQIELRTTQYLHGFMLDILNLLAQHFGGQTTLNHLRIGNYIGLHSLHNHRPTSNKEIAKDLGLSRATVSRIVGDFIKQGWVIEEAHPDDGRRRQLRIAHELVSADRYERAFRSRVNQLLERYDSEKIIKVDSTKRSFKSA